MHFFQLSHFTPKFKQNLKLPKSKFTLIYPYKIFPHRFQTWRPSLESDYRSVSPAYNIHSFLPQQRSQHVQGGTFPTKKKSIKKHNRKNPYFPHTLKITSLIYFLFVPCHQLPKHTKQHYKAVKVYFAWLP